MICPGVGLLIMNLGDCLTCRPAIARKQGGRSLAFDQGKILVIIATESGEQLANHPCASWRLAFPMASSRAAVIAAPR
jgi:hypothetical protein